MAVRKYVTHFDLNKNEIQNVKGQNLSTTPQDVQESQFWYDTTNHTMKFYNGSAVIDMGSQGDYTFQNGVEQVANTRNVQIKLATGADAGNVTLTADSNGLSASITELSVDSASANYLDISNHKISANVDTTVGTVSTNLITSGAVNTALGDYVLSSTKGQANGVASLDSSGKVPTAQLPSFVDDVIDAYIVSGATALSAGWLSATDGGTALTPETGKIYVVLSSGDYQNKTYRWSGTTYVEISASPAQATESAAGIAQIATQSEVNTGTNDTDFVTPLKLATYIGNKKTVVTNPALTASGGVVTWTISTTLAPDCIISVRETSTGAEVYCDVTYGSNSITVKMNNGDVAAGAYTAVVLG